jgi:hypothetical protein
MKKILIQTLIAFVLLLPGLCFSQSYDVSVTNEPFEFLQNGTPAVTETWDDPAFTAPLGFTFDLFGDPVSVLYSQDFFAGGFFSTSLQAVTDVIIALNTDLIDRGHENNMFLSPITYKTEGTTGHRVFTLEFKNTGFYSGEIANDIYTDFINVQLRIYEENDNIQVHIGPYSLTNPGLDFEGFSGPVIGLVNDFDFENDTILGEILVLAGDPLHPDIITDFTPATLIWPIPENTVYTFSPISTGTKETTQTKSSQFYFPNPSTGSVSLFPGNSEKIMSPVFIFNSVGELVRKDIQTEVVELSDLPGGVYELKFQTSDGGIVQRIVLLK